MAEYIVVGKVGKSHGVKGWVKIHSFTEVKTNILRYKPWFLQDKHEWHTVEVEAKRLGNQIVAKFAGIDSPEAAQAFVNKDIAIERSQLPDLAEDEVYWNDLIGLTVINQQQQFLGTVSHLFTTLANAILVVKKEDKEHLIPYILDHHIIKVDIANKQIVVEWDPEF